MDMFDNLLKNNFRTQTDIKLPITSHVLSRLVIIFTVFIILFMSLVPWQQTAVGQGNVIVLDPNERVQQINTQVAGRILHWFVKDGDHVKKGDPIVEIADIDPNLVFRLQKETEAKRSKLLAAISAAETAKKDFDRQDELFKQGLTSSKIFEIAKISYQKLLSEVAHADAELAKSEVTLSRQEIRLVRAPSEGTILNVLSGSGSVLVKEGEFVATFLPDATKLAAEVYISGNDLPLVFKDRIVRLQFEGWPAVQFSGWPAVAVGTFEGRVWAVDPSTTKNGKYRVILVPVLSSKWPDQNYLRQGTKVFAWILLDKVKVGYEMWRQVNGFPPSMDGVLENAKSKNL